MTRILRQAGTGRRYLWTALLARRDDMTEEVAPLPAASETPVFDSEPGRKRERPRKERSVDAG